MIKKIRNISFLSVVFLMLSANIVLSAPVDFDLIGDVQLIDDPLFGGGTTQGISTNDELTVDLTYDDATGVSIGGTLTGFQITSLSIAVPDATQGGFVLTPSTLNTQTLIIFDQADNFVGLLLPINLTGFDSITAFSLSGLAFESEGTNGPTFRFNQTNSVVRGIFITQTSTGPISVQVPMPLISIVLFGLIIAGIGALRLRSN